MGTFRQIYYHIVFGTKFRELSVLPEIEKPLYNYIWGIVKAHDSKLYQINGMPDHIHIFTDLHPAVLLSKFVKEIKVASNLWLKQSGSCPSFSGWAEGYGAFTCSEQDKDRVIGYIKGQKAHHVTECYEDEYRRLLTEHGISFDEKYLF